jgi:hypothetical protein
MKKKTLLLFLLACLCACARAQTDTTFAGVWPTWLIPSGKHYRLAAPAKTTTRAVLERQRRLDATTRQEIQYWHAGAPSYRWEQLLGELWMSDAAGQGVLANMLLSVAVYDATVAAWDTKYTYRRKRPFEADRRVLRLAPYVDSPGYPCEYSVTAGAAATVIAHFFPRMADSVQQMAHRVMDARLAAGMAYPEDTRAGFALGQRIAEAAIVRSKGYLDSTPWDGKVPEGAMRWKGAFALLPHAGNSTPMALERASQFRPGPPPDYRVDMEELKNLKQTPATMLNALKFGYEPVWETLLDQKIFEYNLPLDPPRAARAYALAAIGTYDAFIACWDAKYSYWGWRPDHMDPSFKPLLTDPPFPAYPSGHAAVGATLSEIYAALFPAEQALFREMALQGAESRFQAGSHFRTDNEVALVLGRQVAQVVLKKAGLK